MFNTDQGSQFTSLEFTQVLQEHGVKISMDGKGRYTDNIFVERLWRTVKYEEVYLKAYANASEARRELGAYLRFYNDQRPHQALGYRTPAEVFHQVTDVGEEGAVQAKESPIDQTLVSLAGAAGLSPNSTSILSNWPGPPQLDGGEIDTTLLTANTYLRERIQAQPLLEWKAQNVRRHKGLIRRLPTGNDLPQGGRLQNTRTRGYRTELWLVLTCLGCGGHAEPQRELLPTTEHIQENSRGENGSAGNRGWQI